MFECFYFKRYVLTNVVLVLYRNGWTDLVDFRHRSYSWLLLYCVVRDSVEATENAGKENRTIIVVTWLRHRYLISLKTQVELQHTAQT